MISCGRERVSERDDEREQVQSQEDVFARFAFEAIKLENESLASKTVRPWPDDGADTVSIWLLADHICL